MTSIGTTLLLFALLAGSDPAATLRIESQPAVEVIWEGVAVGATDDQGLLVIDEAPQGTFQLEFRKAEFHPQQRAVDLGPGLTTLAVVLLRIERPTASRPTPNQQTSPQSTPAPTETAETEEGAEAPPPPEAQEPDSPMPDAPLTESPTEGRPTLPDSRPSPGLWIAAILAGAGLIFFLARSQQATGTPQERPKRRRRRSPPPPEPQSGAGEGARAESGFLEELRSRERSQGGNDRSEEIVDAEVIDVTYIEDET